jgi:hypothetical protein
MPPKPKPLSIRFWAKVDKGPGDNGHGPHGCWLWTGARMPSGYGVIGRGCAGSGMELAHRVAGSTELVHNNRGERHHKAKLTTAQVSEVRRRYGAGEMQTALALEFGVSKGAIANIVHGHTWRSVA